MQSSHNSVQGPFTPNITVVGVGGAGGNAVNNMIASKLDGVSFVVCNTDAQALENSLSSDCIQLGSESTGGLGAGARPEVGRVAAEESMDDVMAQLHDQNMVFITAGMGGGTGTGAAPVIAKACKEQGILTVGVVTKPFQFEGAQRMRLAESGIDELAQYVDTLIVIPNQNLFRIANEKTTFADAFKLADQVLQSGVRGVTDLMVVPGMINLDFADVRSATSEMGKAMMGTGEATGERRAIEAAEQAINNPLLDDVSMKGARSVIINISGGHDMTLFEIEEASNRITDEVDPDATIIFGSTFDDSLDGSIRVTVVATGIDAEINRRVATRPIRPTNVNTQPQKVTAPSTPVSAENVEAQALAPQGLEDSFATRYPEPSHVAQAQEGVSYNAVAQQPASAPVAQPMGQPNQTPMPSDQQQSAVASLNATPVQQSMQQVEVGALDAGVTEANYMTDGNAVRKVEHVQQPYKQDEQNHVPSYNNSVIPPHGPAKSPVENTMQSTVQSTPPVPPMVQQAQKEERRTPSLFERITGRKRDEEVSVQNEEETSSGSGAGSTSMPSGLNVDRKTVAINYDAPSIKGEQGTLGIDTPKVTAKTNNASTQGENLDIPAFLRRQIS